jgi:hypothetical protein
MAFEAELSALKNPVGNPADAGTTISVFLAKKKEGVTAITEVSFISVDVRACSIIVYPACPHLCNVGEGPQYRS